MFWPALIFGLLSSLHCVGMCGAIALMLPLGKTSGIERWSRIFLYHLGRLCSYSGIGFLFGLFGKTLMISGMQQRMSIVAGVLMLLIALVPERIIGKIGFFGPVAIAISRIKSALAQRFSKTSLISFFSIGLLNGLLPCGLVYAAVFGAMASGDAVSGAFFMAFFGLGTVPMLLSVSVLGNFFGPDFRNRLVKIVPIAVASLGILFILRGSNLGIPYLSPSSVNLRVMADPNCK